MGRTSAGLTFAARAYNLRDLSGANLGGVNLNAAGFGGATFAGRTSAERTSAVARPRPVLRVDWEATLQGADLSGANLSEAYLGGANLSEADLSRANLSEANLSWAALVETNLADAALIGCRIYGISAWNVKVNEGTKQQDLIITREGEPAVTVDNIEVAQFVYLLLHNEKIRDVIDTIGKRAFCSSAGSPRAGLWSWTTPR